MPGLDSAVGPSLEIAGTESQQIQDEVKPPCSNSIMPPLEIQRTEIVKKSEIQQDAPILAPSDHLMEFEIRDKTETPSPPKITRSGTTKV